MNMHSGKFYVGLTLAIIYMLLAAAMVCEDRKSQTGSFISLQGMLSALVTLPVAFPLEYLGHKLNYKSNLQMAAAIAVCGTLVLVIIWGTLSLGAALWTTDAAPH